MPSPDRLQLISFDGFRDYALLDCGAGRKLERFGSIVVDRPESQALWSPKLPKSEWSKAHAIFSASGEDDEKGKWRVDKRVPDAWPVRIPLQEAIGTSRKQSGNPPTPAPSPRGGGEMSGQSPRGGGEVLGADAGGITMLCKLAGLWHLGLFPEQYPHWQWMLERLASVKGETPRVLNLFGYTGAASLIAAKAGAEVTHVDASKKAIHWGKENQATSKLDSAKIRWLLDDAAKFVARDVRRGKTYHMILVDPPKFGRGPDGEVWDLFKNLPELLENLVKLLAAKDAAMVLTVYAIRASALAFDQLMREALDGRGGSFESGELAIRSQSAALVPTSLYVRWSARP
jgi:23S rRNA (cytosine1962-C5)-methyltransferase